MELSNVMEQIMKDNYSKKVLLCASFLIIAIFY